MRHPSRRTMIRTRVARTERTTDHFLTVTLTGEELAEFEFLGLDQCTRILFPRPGQDRLYLPEAAEDDGWVAEFRAMPDDRRPHVRNYTVRRFDPDALEMDIEFVAHGDGGPASAWALAAREGDELGLYPEGVYYLPSEDTDWQLLVGDESAVPALLSILEQAPEEMRGQAFLEVPSDADVRPVRAPAGVEVRWLPRTDPHAVPGRLALETVRGIEPPGGRPYCFVAGENALPTELRRTLVRERGVPKEDVSFIGYWRHGVEAYP
ncbi:NADPH-dependent ferric siderophore reductase [Nocardiopsis sinuspersici]|uniref:NADPH-dependent ferric siderophore reductase n=2 Tax=Nocardiopsidaceae TaxID=83676 RepID=A0A1V3C8S3_9ACTN|nr:NADPH-dependent ferric siderophore reductase [Nocardiopsis sinuspersici]